MKENSTELNYLLDNFNGENEVCIRILELASYHVSYLPYQENYERLNSNQYSHEKGHILECVKQEADLGNTSAENALLNYFEKYYALVKETGCYKDPRVFFYAENLYSKRALGFYFELAKDRSKNLYSGHAMLPISGINKLGQALVLSRIVAVNDKPIDEFNGFWDRMNEFINIPEIRKLGRRVHNSDIWEYVYLPIIDEAIKNNRIQFRTNN